MDNIVVSENIEITLYFSLALETGEVIDSNFDSKPASFVLGDGSLLPGFEKKLIGMEVGAKNDFVISLVDGFGVGSEENFQTFKRDSFSDISPEVGLVISFKEPSGGELPGVIASFTDDEVVVDFNHPLAGKSIIFTVEIVDLKPAVTH